MLGIPTLNSASHHIFFSRKILNNKIISIKYFTKADVKNMTALSPLLSSLFFFSFLLFFLCLTGTKKAFLICLYAFPHVQNRIVNYWCSLLQDLTDYLTKKLISKRNKNVHKTISPPLSFCYSFINRFLFPGFEIYAPNISKMRSPVKCVSVLMPWRNIWLCFIF